MSNAAGCGSGLRDYKLMFRGTPDEDRAAAFAKKVCDASEFLDRLGFTPPPELKRPLRVAYHDACHLAHAQGVRSAPRKLLRSVGNLTLLEVPDGDTCCGSAGTYNLDQPEIAAELGGRKARNVSSTGCDIVAAGNIGCMVQLRAHLGGQGRTPGVPRVLHTMQVLQRCLLEGGEGLVDAGRRIYPIQYSCGWSCCSAADAKRTAEPNASNAADAGSGTARTSNAPSGKPALPVGLAASKEISLAWSRRP